MNQQAIGNTTGDDVLTKVQFVCECCWCCNTSFCWSIERSRPQGVEEYMADYREPRPNVGPYCRAKVPPIRNPADVSCDPFDAIVKVLKMENP